MVMSIGSSPDGGAAKRRRQCRRRAWRLRGPICRCGTRRGHLTLERIEGGPPGPFSSLRAPELNALTGSDALDACLTQDPQTRYLLSTERLWPRCAAICARFRRARAAGAPCGA